jgi:predicted ATP-grasp superfamily ATP-dependent carboligase
VAKQTQTMRALLEARQGAPFIAIAGARQASAARALVAQGMAARYVSQTKIIAPRRYWDNFGRVYAWTREYADIGGILYFE